MIDTHAHLYDEKFKDDLDSVLTRAYAVGVQKILMPNIDVHTIDAMLKVEEKYPTTCMSMMGLHPCYVKEDYEEQLEVIAKWFQKRDFLAVGEIGTDLYWDKTFWEQQKHAFLYQCDLALKQNLPVVIHCRDSINETIEMVQDYALKGLKGVFHCFTGSIEQANKITEMGFFLGLGGVCTFKNGGMNKVVPHLDKAKILLETDAPYLAPTPHRGKRNEPCFLQETALKIAEYLNMSKEDLISMSIVNTKNLFLIS